MIEVRVNMRKLFLPLVLVTAACPVIVDASCDTQLPSKTEVPLETQPNNRWFGSDELAISLPENGNWRGMGSANDFRDKLWLWRRGFNAESEIPPKLELVAVKIDSGSPAEKVEIRRAGGAMGPGWAAMVTALHFSSPGCWRVSVHYTYLASVSTLEFTLDVSDGE